MDKIRIVLVDDHLAFRNSLKVLLESQPDLSVVAVAGDGLSAIEIVQEHQPDLVLMDFRLPRRSGVEATRVIKSKFPKTKVIVLTLFSDDGHLTEALEAGAHDCLSKDGYFQGMLNAIRNCCTSPPTKSFNHRSIPKADL